MQNIQKSFEHLEEEITKFIKLDTYKRNLKKEKINDTFSLRVAIQEVKTIIESKKNTTNSKNWQVLPVNEYNKISNNAWNQWTVIYRSKGFVKFIIDQNGLIVSYKWFETKKQAMQTR